MPFNRSKYPDNWEWIREQILSREGDCCKFCGIGNYTVYQNHKEGLIVLGGPFIDYATGRQFANTSKDGGIDAKMIVLTIAHLHDPDPMNVNPDNLAALCQRCHNEHDRPMRMANAKATREAKKNEGQISIFDND